MFASKSHYLRQTWLRKKKFNEINVADPKAKDQMRSAQILEMSQLQQAVDTIPADVERALLETDSDV